MNSERHACMRGHCDSEIIFVGTAKEVHARWVHHKAILNFVGSTQHLMQHSVPQASWMDLKDFSCLGLLLLLSACMRDIFRKTRTTLALWVQLWIQAQKKPSANQRKCRIEQTSVLHEFTSKCWGHFGIEQCLSCPGRLVVRMTQT